MSAHRRSERTMDQSQPPSPSVPPVVLIVDDEEALVDLIAVGLRFHGFAPVTAANGRDALVAVERHRPALVVLDVNLPGDDGFEVCRKLRAYGSSVPVVFLTARDEPEAVHAGFTKGGDDYVTKPFRIDELALRIKAILRRVDASTVALPDRIECGGLTIDHGGQRVQLFGDEVLLSQTEYRLLRFLAINRDLVVSRYQILEHVWFDDGENTSSLVETYIGYLRKKLDGHGPMLIHTVRGSGYVMRTPPLRDAARP